MKKKGVTNLKVALKEANESVSCNKNFVCSPVSIEVLLSIVAVGSTGETRNQILKFLGSKTLKAINQKALEVMDIVHPETDDDGSLSEGPLVSFVNGAWVDRHFSLQPSFQALIENTYRAEAKAVDFQQKEEVCREVNSWASRATKGLIDMVLSPGDLKQDSMLILGNALFFKAAWQYPFVCGKNRIFHLLTGETVEAPFMTKRSPRTFTGASFDDFKLVRMPYKREQDKVNRLFAMYIILPDDRDGLVSLLQRFSEDSSFLDQKDFKLQPVLTNTFWIPKFKFSHTFSASDTLKQLGLDRMFKPVNELSKIVDKTSSPLLYVSDFYQKSCIEVDEEGTMAASVKLLFAGGGGPNPYVFDFVADHPFMFMIREETSGVTFFVGTVLNPVSGQ